MKKVLQILAVAVMVLVPFAAGDSALAAGKGTCRVGFTGPDSSNMCTSTRTYACTVTNNNQVDVTNENVQVSISGGGSGSGNTSGGSVSSGSATNSNGVTFNATVNNLGVCAVTATIPATPPATSAPQGGKGATKQPVAAPHKQAATVLPNTSADSALPILATLAGALGISAILSRLAVAAYNRIKS